MSPPDLLYAQLIRDALDLLDRHGLTLGQRDPAKSLNEDSEDLLGRVRAALEPLASEGPGLRADVTDMLRRIDDARAAAAPAQAPGPGVDRSAFSQ
jgi:hypothetical protein